MSYIITVTERAPTPDGTDINTYHVQCETVAAVLNYLDEFWVNFGIPIVITIVENEL